MNSVVLIGRLGNDPEMRYSPSGTAITKFRLAVTRRRGRATEGEERKEETDWLDIVTFGVTAENCGQYLDKGAHVALEGRVQSSTWEGTDGQKKYRVEIIANTVEFLESKFEADRRRSNAGSRGGGGGAPAGRGPGEAEPPYEVPEGEDYFG